MMDTDHSVDVLDHTEPATDAATSIRMVQPVDYSHLRLLAECAAGSIGRPVDYAWIQEPSGRPGRMEPVLKQTAPGADPGPAAVVVLTADTGRYPGNRVELQVATPGGHLTGAPAGHVDALFWSDAAVQKFLLPYLASCAGSRAGDVLNTVQDAWNRYPWSRVTVYALMHVNAFPSETPLHLEDTLLVAFTLKGSEKLDLLSVRAFVDSFGSEPPPEPLEMEVEYHRGRPGRASQRPGYVQLRALAEWACSIRDQPQYFVFRAGEHGFHPHNGELPSVGSGDIVIPARTATVPAGRPALGMAPGNGAVWFTPEGGVHPVNLAGEGDALFWSTAAIEQFVFPYYASKGGLQALPDLAELVQAWTGQPPAGGDYEGAWTEDAAGVRAEDRLMNEGVMGLLHLPTSEWTEVTADWTAMPETRVDLTRQLGVMTVDAAGGTHTHRLDRFMARRRGT
ncbi:MAG TPA: hypothetical protein VLK84_05940 [Longimicrobium sp.]|nr:hypothetical protein [Longimicrobium sp.]